MAKNDKLLIDGIIDDRLSSNPSVRDRGDAFEIFAIEQILKDHDLSSDEIYYGRVDGRGDGGIDGFYIFINGHPLQEADSFMWPKSNSELHVVFITSKHHDTFVASTIESLISSLTELLDFTIDNVDLSGSYSSDIIKRRSHFKSAYRRLSPRLSHFMVDVIYASRGDLSSLGSEVKSRADQIIDIIKNSFGSCEARFLFIGASELIDMHRRMPTYSMELPFVEVLSKGERYILLARLSDYFSFINDNGKMRRHLFDSNVRDFMGLNRVNDDIRSTLNERDSEDFWLFNNGVTILSSAATIIGDSIRASDVQIVNGLQTTETIFRYFSQNEIENDHDERCILVKIIVSTDNKIRDKIIQATNNQTIVELSSLHATDKIQRDIEDILIKYNLYYERRKNYYLNLGHSPSEIISPTYAAAASVGIFLKSPHKATTFRSKIMRNDQSYNLIFDPNTPLDAWPIAIRILIGIDKRLEDKRHTRVTSEKFLKGWRYIVAFMSLSKVVGTYSYSFNDLLKLNVEHVIDQFDVVWSFLNRNASGQNGRLYWSSYSNVRNACELASNEFNIKNFQCIKSNTLPSVRGLNSREYINDDFAQLVLKYLPEQPWKPGIHKDIIKLLQCTQSDYHKAVERLIELGHVLYQRDGIVYDNDGNVLKIDTDRVDPITLTLLDDRSDT